MGYDSLYNLDIQQCEGFLLVYSTTSRDSFNDIPRFHARIPRSNSPAVLVANKKDESEREVAREEFIETSAKMGINVEKAFHGVACMSMGLPMRRRQKLEGKGRRLETLWGGITKCYTG